MLDTDTVKIPVVFGYEMTQEDYIQILDKYILDLNTRENIDFTTWKHFQMLLKMKCHPDNIKEMASIYNIDTSGKLTTTILSLLRHFCIELNILDIRILTGEMKMDKDDNMLMVPYELYSSFDLLDEGFELLGKIIKLLRSNNRPCIKNVNGMNQLTIVPFDVKINI